VIELPTDDRAHSFQLMGALGGDVRPDIFQLVVQKGWLLLEMRRDAQTLEDVFKVLTKGDERKDRGRKYEPDEDDDDDASPTLGAAGGDADDDEDEGDDDEGDDEDEDGDDEGDDADDAEDEPKKKKG
jgi:ABC-2 type transport system ATP-binding protein